MTWVNDVRRANEALDWIEQRQGPLPADGYARIETTVGRVRAMTEQDDAARIAEIRARLEAATPGPWGYNSYSGVFGPPDLCAADDGPDYPESPRPTPGSPEDRGWVAQRSAAYEADPRVCKVPALYGDTAIGRHAADAEFIAHAREDVPYLLARLDALAAEASDVARENEALIEEVKAAGEQIAALAAERDARIKTLENDLEHALASVGAFRQAVENVFAKAEEHEVDQGGMIVTYVLPCGPLHRAIGLARGTDAGGKLLKRLGDTEAERDAAVARAERAESALRDVDGALFSIAVDLMNRKLFYVDREMGRLRERVSAALAAASEGE